MIAVQNDIPLPKQGARAIYPWLGLEVGESFPLAPGIKLESAYTVVSNANTRYSPKRFTCRKYKGEMRCWRVA